MPLLRPPVSGPAGSRRVPGRGATGPALVHRSLGRRRSGRQVALTTPLLAATPEARRLVLAAVDHELRTPLTNIVGLVEMLLDGEAGELCEDQARMLQRIDVSAERLLAIVTALLDGCSTGLRRGEVVDLAGAVVDALGGADALCARVERTAG